MKTVILITAAALSFACSNTARPVAQSNTPVTNQTPDRSETAIAHSSEKQMPPAATNGSSNGTASKWSSGGEAIDTTKFDSAIMAAEKKASSKPSDEAAKKELSAAYYDRAVALTDARQYASALGDYRRAVRTDPNNSEAKEWIDKIVMIYGSLKKEAPAVGAEPPPMPFKKS